MERTIGVQGDEVIENLAGVFRRAVRGQPHQLVFARVDAESAVSGERGIEQAKGVGE